MKKILEIKGDDWKKGLSLQFSFPHGGLFQSAPGFDPFERVGFLQPALAPTELTAPSTNPIKAITAANISGTSYILAHSETKLYKYLAASPFTQTDITSSVDFTSPIGLAFVGAILWKGYYIYAQATDLLSWDLDATSTQILNGSGSQDLTVRHMCIGADKNLYVGDYASIAKCILHTGTSGNSLNAFLIDAGYTVRALINDGRYLVILADNNAIATTSRTVGAFNCRVYFWDMSKTTADVIYDINDAYLIGGGYFDGAVYLFGYNGIYICNDVTAPKQIASFLGNSTLAAKRPTTPYQITVGSNAIYWADGNTNGQNVYAFGYMPGDSKNKVFFTPYISHGSTYAHTSLLYSAGTVFAGTTGPHLYANNTGTTRQSATVLTCPTFFDNPYTYVSAKVSLRGKMTSGQAVALGAYTADGSVISDIQTVSYSASNPRKNITFKLKPTTGSTSQFEDLYMYINPQGGAVIDRVSVYANEVSDLTQTL